MSAPIIYCWRCSRDLESFADACLESHEPYAWTGNGKLGVAGQDYLEVECSACVERDADSYEPDSGYCGSDTIESRMAAQRLK